MAEDNTYSPLFAFVYTFNLIVGIGALALPRAFNNSGLLLGIILLFVLCVVSYITSTFVIEAMAAANAYHRLSLKTKSGGTEYGASPSEERIPFEDSDKRLHGKQSINSSIQRGFHDSATEDAPLISTAEQDRPSSAYEISEKYELGSMANMFFPTVGVVLYYVIVCLYLFGDLTIYAVAAPISVTKVVCDMVNHYTSNNETALEEDGFMYSDVLSSSSSPGTCDNNSTYTDNCIGSLNKTQVYYIFLAVFFLTVGPFCYINMTKTKILQIITTIMRYLAFFFMILLAVLKIAQGHYNHPPIADFTTLPSLFGITVYSFMCQHSLPGMVTPMRGKKWVYWMLAGDFGLSCLFYLLLTITGSFAFQSCEMKELYSLDFFNPGGEIVKLIIGTYLALFPVFTLSTNFPIIAVTLRENIKSLVRLALTSFKIEIEFPFIVDRLLFPTITLLPPLAISYATQQDALLVSITGSFPGVGVQYLIPAALVLMGRYTMRKKFGSYDNQYKSPVGHFIVVGIVVAWSFVSVILIIVNMALNPPQLHDHPIN